MFLFFRKGHSLKENGERTPQSLKNRESVCGGGEGGIGVMSQGYRAISFGEEAW